MNQINELLVIIKKIIHQIIINIIIYVIKIEVLKVHINYILFQVINNEENELT